MEPKHMLKPRTEECARNGSCQKAIQDRFEWRTFNNSSHLPRPRVPRVALRNTGLSKRRLYSHFSPTKKYTHDIKCTPEKLKLE